MSVNVITLHSGVAADDAHYSGTWTYWDDYQRVSMGNAFDFEDAGCVGNNAGQEYFFVSPRTPTGVVVRIADDTPPVATTYTKPAFSGKGSDVCYDATNNKLYVLWSDLGNITITKMDVATWTEDATKTFSGFDDSSKPSLCINANGTALYVLTFGGADATPTQLLKITGLATFSTASVAESLKFYVGNRLSGHCVRLDPTDTNSVYCSGLGSWRARVNISGSPMVITWETTQLPHVLPPTTVTIPFHDDIAFDSTYAYLIASISGSGAQPGALRVRKDNGLIVESYYDSAVYTATIDGVGVDVNRTTREIMATQGRGHSLPVWSLDDHVMRERNTPDGRNPDDQFWSTDGLFIWSIPAVQFWPGRPTYVTRWDKIDGPIGVGRIKAQLNTAHSFTVGAAHALTNTGVYAGLSYALDDFGYAIDHCTLITVTTDGTTATWQARLEVVRSTGTMRLAFPDGTKYTVADTATGWHFAELRYEKATNRWRVYLDNAPAALDITKGSSFNAGQTVFGPWDASGTDTQVLKVHTGYDIQLDDTDYDGARWGEVTACYAALVGVNASYQQWADVGGSALNHSDAINDLPDLLTPAPADDGDATYIQSDGASPTDQWDIYNNRRYTQLVPTMRAVRVGCRAKVLAGAGSFSIGWNGEGSGDPAGTWTLKTITPAGGYAHYEATFVKDPSGTYPIIANSNSYFAFKQAAGAGVDVRITQAVLSLVGSTVTALSFDTEHVRDTTGLDLTARAFASRGVFTASQPQATLSLDVPYRAFAARDLFGQSASLEFLSSGIAHSVALARTVTRTRTLAPAVAHSATLARSVALTRTEASAVGHSATVGRSLALGRAIAPTTTHSAAVGRLVGHPRTVAASVAHSAAVGRSVALSRTLASGIAHSAAVSRAVALTRTLASGIAHAAPVSFVVNGGAVNLTRTIAAGIAHSAAVSKTAARTRAVTAGIASTVVLSRTFARGRIISSGIASTVAVSRLGTFVRRVTSAIGHAVAVATGQQAVIPTIITGSAYDGATAYAASAYDGATAETADAYDGGTVIAT